ncbi:hypothetical protein D9M71_356400 [compost metagenome]
MGNVTTLPVGPAPSLDLDFVAQRFSVSGREQNYADLISHTRASSATFIDRSGVRRLAAANQPRFDYDPVTGLCRGLLIEEQRTNLLRQSASYDSAAWLKGGGISVTAPLDNAWGLNGSPLQLVTLSGTEGHHLWQVLPSALTIGVAYTLTLDVVAKTAPFPIQLSYYDASTSLHSVLTTPTAVGVLQRLRFTFTPTFSAVSPQIRLIGFSSGTAGAQLYLGESQLEAGDSPTSNIPTTTAAATRAADVVSLASLSPWFNPTETTVIVEAMQSFTPTATPGPRAFSLFTNTTTYASMARASNGACSVDVTNSGTGQIPGVSTVVADGVPFRGILALKVNDAAGAVNGLSLKTSASAAMPAPVQAMIGQRGAGVAYWNGYVRRVMVFGKRLPNSQLTELSR